MCCEDRRGKKSIGLSSLGKNKHVRKLDTIDTREKRALPTLCAKVMGILHLAVSLFLPSSFPMERGVFFVCFFKAIEGCHLLEDVITMLAIGLCSALPSLSLLAVGRVGLEGGAVFPFLPSTCMQECLGQFPGAHTGQWSRRQSQGPVCILSPGL